MGVKEILMTSTYEIMTIAKGGLGENSAKELSKLVQSEIVSLGGEVTKTNFWGKRKFAYEIDHDTEGYYDVILLSLEKDKVATLKSKLNLMEGLVRYLITAVETQVSSANSGGKE